MRMTRVKIDGQTYDIPDMWLFSRTQRGYSTLEAVRYWHEQALMEAEFNTQREREAA